MIKSILGTVGLPDINYYYYYYYYNLSVHSLVHLLVWVVEWMIRWVAEWVLSVWVHISCYLCPSARHQCQLTRRLVL